MPVDGPQLGDAKTAKVFNKNFFDDFKQALGQSDKALKKKITKFDKLDFTAIR